MGGERERVRARAYKTSSQRIRIYHVNIAHAQSARRTSRAYFFFGRTFDLVFSQTVALLMRDYALSRDSAYCLPTFQLYRVTQVVAEEGLRYSMYHLLTEYYSVNTTVGFCTCLKGKDGSPCVHQAAVVIQCGEYGLNFSTSASSSARQKLAQIELGDGAIQDTGFFIKNHLKDTVHVKIETIYLQTNLSSEAARFVQVLVMELKTMKQTAVA